METVSEAKRNIPHQRMIQKVKGRTFYLPLPIEETLKKICKPTDPININQEFYILVRSLSTKPKTVWEHLVNIKNVYNALVRLKRINRLYENIILPPNPNELLKTDWPEVEYQETRECLAPSIYIYIYMRSVRHRVALLRHDSLSRTLRFPNVNNG